MTSQTPSPENLRAIELVRHEAGRYEARNARGGTIAVGGGDGTDFTPVELLLVALAGCSAIDVDLITGRRAEPDRFAVRAEGFKIRDDQGNRLTDLRVLFDTAFPADEAGDAARAALPRALQQTRDRLCSVGRTLAVASPVEYVERDSTDESGSGSPG